MSKRRAEYYAMNGMEETRIDADCGVKVVTNDGQCVEIYFRRSDGEITITTKGRAVIEPAASNCFRVRDEK